MGGAFQKTIARSSVRQVGRSLRKHEPGTSCASRANVQLSQFGFDLLLQPENMLSECPEFFLDRIAEQADPGDRSRRYFFAAAFRGRREWRRRPGRPAADARHRRRSSALTRGSAHFVWRWRVRTRSGTTGVGGLPRSIENYTPSVGHFDLSQKRRLTLRASPGAPCRRQKIRPRFPRTRCGRAPSRRGGG
jgi:hypothetical protein